MSDASFDIIFCGKLQAGHTLAEVKPRLMQLFKAEASKIDALFSGAALPLKRNLDSASAQKYQAVLAKAGIVVEIVDTVATAKPAVAAKPDPEAVRAARLAEQAKRRAERKVAQGAKPLSMAERLAQAESQPAAPEAPAAETPAPIPAQQGDNSADHLTLAEAGADVLKESERAHVTPVDVDTSALNLREGGGELLDASERAPEVVLDLDLHEYNLADAGADLLAVDERAVVEAVAVDISQLVLDEASGELLHADEKPVVEAVQVNIGAIDLAPAGSDLGQLKSDKPALNPDTSKISLAP